MDFVAIDFETASGNRNSACQLAVVNVRNGEIKSEDCWLIRPPRLYFSQRNIAIHGIRPQDVRNAPTMDQIWQELESKLRGRVVLAHNAGFDIGVLVGSLAAFEIACPKLEFSCTRLWARGAWPGRSRYGLKALGDWLGIGFKHHDALEDARCCALIALASAKTAQATSLEALEKTLKITRGRCEDGRIIGPRLVRRGGNQFASARSSVDRWGFPVAGGGNVPARVDPGTIVAASANSKPLSGKKISLLGPLRGLSMEQSSELIRQLGGQFQEAISVETNYVVACGVSLEAAGKIVCQAIADSESAGLHNVASTRIMSERQFRALLPGGKATAWR